MKYWLKSNAIRGTLTAMAPGIAPLVILGLDVAESLFNGRAVSPDTDPVAAIIGGTIAIIGGIWGVIGRKNADESIRFK